jgi:hypothetical protein
MLKRSRIALAAGVLLTAAVSVTAYAAGLWSTLPIIGGASYCASTVTGVTLPASQGPYGVVPGSTQGTGVSSCAQTVPGGPATFAGTEMVPLDLLTPGTSSAGPATTALVNINQLGQGTVFDSTSASASITIPANSQFFVLDTGTAATVAVTMPAAAIEGQIQHLLCGVAVGTALSVAANTGQTIKGNTTATCAAGAAFAWRFSAVANGLIVANSWVRIQ